MADATAEADRTLHHHVPTAQGPSFPRRTRFHVREESASVQTGAAGVRELWLNNSQTNPKMRPRRSPEMRSDTSARLRDRLYLRRASYCIRFARENLIYSRRETRAYRNIEEKNLSTGMDLNNLHIVHHNRIFLTSVATSATCRRFISQHNVRIVQVCFSVN